MGEFTGFSGEMILSAISMMLVLVLWIGVLANKRRSDDALNMKLLERQQEIERRKAAETARAEPTVPTEDKPDNGPWG